jgi:Queuosine biosynthesis protein QueC
MDFTHNNHLKYTIGTGQYRTTSMEKYTVELGAVDPDRYAKGSYVGELHRTAELVRKDLGNDLVLFLSGGTDSEIVLRNFVHNGFKPRCVALRFENNYNAGEVEEAIAIARELDVKLDIIDFDVHDFFYSGEATEFGKQIQCTQLTYIMVYHNILKLGGPAVMGGEALLTRQVNLNNSFWYYTFRENEDASAMRFTNKFNVPLVNEWFSYTPELLLHWLEHPKIKELVSTRFNYKLNSASSKNTILSTLYKTRPKAKTHGFESLLAFNYTAYKDIGVDQIKRLESSVDGIPYNLAIKQLKGQR